MTTTRTDNLNASLGANELEIEVAQAGEDGGSASYRFSTWAALIDIVAKLRVSEPNVSEKRVPRDLFPGLSSEDHLVFATSPDFWTGLGVPEHPGCRASASKTLAALVVGVEGYHTGSTRMTKTKYRGFARDAKGNKGQDAPRLMSWRIQIGALTIQRRGAVD